MVRSVDLCIYAEIIDTKIMFFNNYVIMPSSCKYVIVLFGVIMQCMQHKLCINNIIKALICPDVGDPGLC